MIEKTQKKLRNLFSVVFSSCTYTYIVFLILFLESSQSHPKTSNLLYLYKSLKFISFELPEMKMMNIYTIYFVDDVSVEFGPVDGVVVRSLELFKLVLSLSLVLLDFRHTLETHLLLCGGADFIHALSRRFSHVIN